RVTGTGYAPEGKLVSGLAGGEQAKDETTIDPPSKPDLLRALTVGMRCNNARVTREDEADAVWQMMGDPTEGALVVVAMKAGVEPAKDRAIFELPFDADRKAMSVAYRNGERGAEMFTKGAPESLLGNCVAELRNGEEVSLTDARRKEIAEANSQM